MHIATQRPNEAAVLAALRRLAVLDSGPEAEFDALVHAAAAVCEVPVSLISLVDAERQWFKANVGLEASETSRDVAFCSHAVLDEAPLIVPDASEDPRFFDNPLVTGGPLIRFYAGAPIRLTGGEMVGTLCVIDRIPRHLDDRQIAVLSHLAVAAARALEGRIAVREQGAMISALARSQQELSSLNDTLEARITERTRESALAVERAEEASRAKSRFLSHMSHEIRTPINGVIGLTHIALHKTSDPIQRGYLNRILSSSEHLMKIIGSVLDLGKIEADRLTLEDHAFELSHLLDEVEVQFAPMAQAKSLELSFTLDERLRGSWRADPTRLGQILRNYVDNAIKFTSNGKIAVRVLMQELADVADGCTIRVEVEDSGIGLTPEQTRQLFQPFHQADSSTTRLYGGTGLGLSISKRLAELLGGEAGVDSQEAVGSTFWFTAKLRSAGESPCDSAPAVPVTKDLAPEAPLHGVCILVAEDNLINQEVAAALLTTAGAVVHIANDGQHALEIMAEHGFDLVLMDVQMPRLDGLEATKMIRADARVAGTPIIALTANASRVDRERCMDAGMDDFLVKPITPADLYAAVAKWAFATPPERLALRAAGSAASPLESDGTMSLNDELPILDLRILRTYCGGDETKVDRYGEMYLETSAETLEELRSALAAGDISRLTAIAHRQKASSKLVGALRLASLCEALERLTSHPRPEAEAGRLVLAFADALQHVRSSWAVHAGELATS